LPFLSVLAARIRTGSLTVLASLITSGFVKEFAKAHAGLVQLRFRISDGAIHDLRNFVVFVPLYIMEHKHCLVARRELLDGTL
jgi:hypothetical protein